MFSNPAAYLRGDGLQLSVECFELGEHGPYRRFMLLSNFGFRHIGFQFFSISIEFGFSRAEEQRFSGKTGNGTQLCPFPWARVIAP